MKYSILCKCSTHENIVPDEKYDTQSMKIYYDIDFTIDENVICTHDIWANDIICVTSTGNSTHVMSF